MQKFKLPHSGLPPIEFVGELIGAVSGKQSTGRAAQSRQRYHSIEIYRTQGGKFVLFVAYDTEWPGEQLHREVEIMESPCAIVEALRTYSPTAYVKGYPPEERYERKQARLMREIEDRFANLTSVVLDSPYFAEVVP